jgi:Uncharacterised ACR, YggU family COG1872
LSDELPPCLTRHGECLWLAVSVVPNAKRSGADGLHDGALRVRLAAPPVDGKANEALIAPRGVTCPRPELAAQVAGTGGADAGDRGRGDTDGDKRPRADLILSTLSVPTPQHCH